MPLRAVQSPPAMSIQSASGEILRLKRVRRLSSDEEMDLRGGGGATGEKVAATDQQLATYYAAAPGSPSCTTITLPSAGVVWTQADLEQAAALGG